MPAHHSWETGWATRPSVCSGFPYNRVVRTWRECTWYVQVRDAEGRVIEVVDAAADGSGPAPPVAADLAVLTMGELAELNQANQGGDA